MKNITEDMIKAARKYAQHPNNRSDPFAFNRALSRMKWELAIPQDYLEKHDHDIA